MVGIDQQKYGTLSFVEFRESWGFDHIEIGKMLEVGKSWIIGCLDSSSKKPEKQRSKQQKIYTYIWKNTQILQQLGCMREKYGSNNQNAEWKFNKQDPKCWSQICQGSKYHARNVNSGHNAKHPMLRLAQFSSITLLILKSQSLFQYPSFNPWSHWSLNIHHIISTSESYMLFRLWLLTSVKKQKKIHVSFMYCSYHPNPVYHLHTFGWFWC